MVGFENEMKVEVIEFRGYFIHTFSLGLLYVVHRYFTYMCMCVLHVCPVPT